MAKWKDESMSDLLLSVQGDSQNLTNGTMMIDLKKLQPFSKHPFQNYTDSQMQDMLQSVQEFGIISPIIVRPTKNSTYEIISGHNRVQAAKLAGMKDIAALIKDVDDETATIMMVDSNFQQRQELRFSEKAFAYKMKLDAIKNQGKRNDLTSAHSAQRLTAREKVAQNTGESQDTIRRYIRLTYLISDLLEKVDQNKLGFIPAVSISYLTEDQQTIVNELIDLHRININKAQAETIKKISEEKSLSRENLFEILCKAATKSIHSPKVSLKQFKALLPKSMQNQAITQERADKIFEEAMLLWGKQYQETNK